MPTSTSEVAAETRQAVLRLARLLRNARPPGGLSLNQLSVLSNLRRLGPMHAGELAAYDNQQPQTLTRVFAELERGGLIMRSADNTDRRRLLVRITTAGQEALTSEMRARDVWLASAMGTLSETELEVVRLAARLLIRLDRNQSLPG